MLLKPKVGWTSSELYLQNAATEQTKVLASMWLENETIACEQHHTTDM